MLTATAFLLAYFTGCLLALARHPIFGLVTYVGVFYLHPPSRWWGAQLPSLRWSLLAAGVTLAGVWLRRSTHRGPPLSSYGLLWGLCVLFGWLAVQSLWALEPAEHQALLVLAAKYILLLWLMHRCIDSTVHLKYFLWSHAAGCFFLGTIVFSEYTGGRFEGFGGPGIDDANSGGLQVATGVVITFALFLSGRWVEKAVAIGFMPFTLNALVATISRSGFLAITVIGVLFNLFAPKRHLKLIRVLSVVGLVLFISLTNDVYWERIHTILSAGEEIEGKDTGVGRLVLIDAQFSMFSENVLGCGHRCTATLSRFYLEDRYLTGPEGNRARSSHNTFMTLLVEQGIFGAILYGLLLIWMAKHILKLRVAMRHEEGIISTTYAATVGVLCAMTVGDMFVDYLKLEARIWFLALLIVLEKLVIFAKEDETEAAGAKGEAKRASPAVPT